MAININDLTIEQKIVLHLAKKGFLTANGDIQRALRDNEYAKFLITGNGLYDEFEDIIQDILPDIDDCNHEALTNEEIQIVFDNDNE
jgi:hypothetical protein